MQATQEQQAAQQAAQQYLLPIEDVAREMGLKDVAILQLQAQIKQIRDIPGVQEAINSYLIAQNAQQAPALASPVPTPAQVAAAAHNGDL